MPSESARDSDIVLVGAARTPFARFGGSLAPLPIPQLARQAIVAALARSGVEPTAVDEVALGVNLPGSDRSLARQALLHAGIPTDRVAYTVDRACCSSLSAITLASRSLRLGEQIGRLATAATDTAAKPR